ncbi:hypothetical protein [Vibrio neptunius]|uniref:hypothetical protein n=1 Tax=Vibrio neptunius TaxID=170651 RepID=UPI001C5CBA87|nr:hypothetical protein [Vibrio neptunius]QXX05753.1 hypothetical protein KW548_11190 [Vibrio neptunius]
MFNPERNEVRLYFTKTCPISGDTSVEKGGATAAIAAAVIPSIINTAVESIVSASKQAGEDKEYSASAIQSGHFYNRPWDHTIDTINSDTGCMVLVAGNFWGEEDLSALPDYLKPAKVEKNGEITSFYKFIGLKQSPTLYIEFDIDASSNRKAFRLITKVLYQSETLLKHKNEGVSEDIVLAFDYRKPGSSEDSGTFASSALILTGVELGHVYTPDKLVTNSGPVFTSTWMSLPELEADAKNTLIAINKLNDDIGKDKETLCLLELELEGSSANCEAFYELDIFSDQIKKTYIDKVNAKAAHTESKRLKEIAEAKNESSKKAVDAKYKETIATERYTSTSKLINTTLTHQERGIELQALKRSLVQAGFFEVHMQLTETTKGNAFFAKVGNILSTSEDDLKKALKAKYDPTTKKANEDALAKEMEADLVALYTLQGQLIEAERKLNKAQIDMLAVTDEKSRIDAQFNIASAELEVTELKRRIALLE